MGRLFPSISLMWFFSNSAWLTTLIRFTRCLPKLLLPYASLRFPAQPRLNGSGWPCLWLFKNKTC